MSSFWSTSDGTAITVDKSKVDTGNNFELIMDGTNCLVRIEDAGWTEFQGTNYIRVKATVLQPEEYEGRKVSKSLYVTDPQPDWKEDDRAKKTAKARNDLGRMDAFHKGKLQGNGGAVPTDEHLKIGLIGAQQIWTMGVFTPKGQDPRQFVKAINGKGMVDITPSKAKAKPRPTAPLFGGDDDGDDVPY